MLFFQNGSDVTKNDQRLIWIAPLNEQRLKFCYSPVSIELNGFEIKKVLMEAQLVRGGKKRSTAWNWNVYRTRTISFGWSSGIKSIWTECQQHNSVITALVSVFLVHYPSGVGVGVVSTIIVADTELIIDGCTLESIGLHLSAILLSVYSICSHTYVSIRVMFDRRWCLKSGILSFSACYAFTGVIQVVQTSAVFI